MSAVPRYGARPSRRPGIGIGDNTQGGAIRGGIQASTCPRWASPRLRSPRSTASFTQRRPLDDGPSARAVALVARTACPRGSCRSDWVGASCRGSVGGRGSEDEASPANVGHAPGGADAGQAVLVGGRTSHRPSRGVAASWRMPVPKRPPGGGYPTARELAGVAAPRGAPMGRRSRTIQPERSAKPRRLMCRTESQGPEYSWGS